MQGIYKDVITRFLRKDEKLLASEETEMPLVIEAQHFKDLAFLQKFLLSHSKQIINNMSTFGAVLLRGFNINSDEDFENAVSSIEGFQGISEAFMSEHGRIPVRNLKYVLYTNAVYKTGGTLYLGGFHSENYYTPDVPSYIFFCCHKPSIVGGETGLVNMEKVYQHLDNDLKAKLENNSFFVTKWLVSEVSARYQISVELIEKICKEFDLPIIGKGSNKFILMYKPSVFEHPLTNKKALQINLFELPTLNKEMRKCFMNDYTDNTWFWHRFVWKLPSFVFKIIEQTYVMFASMFYSPKESLTITKTKINEFKASIINATVLSAYNQQKVGSCFNDKDIKHLAKLIRSYYSSCLWRKGDILLVDNKKVAHAGMPGSGPRLIRALISNPIDMKYSSTRSGVANCKNRERQTVGYYVEKGQI